MKRSELTKGMSRVGTGYISVFNLLTGVRNIKRVVYQSKDGDYYCVYNGTLRRVTEKGE